MDYELIVLSLATRNKECFHELVSELKPDHFQDKSYQQVFNTINKIYEDELPCDLRIVDARLIENGHKKTAEQFRIKYQDAINTFHFRPAVKKLKERLQKRLIYNLSSDIMDGIKKGLYTLDDVHEKMSEGLLFFDSKSSDITVMADYAKLELEEIFEKTHYQKTGIQQLDEVLRGLYSTQLVIIAARPGQGKTSLAIQMAANMEDSYFLSLEMNKRELWGRMLSMRAKVQSWQIEHDKMTFEEKKAVIHAKMFYQHNLKMSVLENIQDIGKLLVMAEREIEKGKCKSLFIDYLQLVKGGQGENQNLKIADITRKLKLFALKNKIPVVLLSQLNREMEKTKRPPMLSDLRDSGSIEQDADRVIFIYDNDGQYELRIAKNRNGKTAEIPITFNKKFTCFGDNTATGLEFEQAEF